MLKYPAACFSAGVAELVDALDLGSSDESRGGSSPFARTSLRERSERRLSRRSQLGEGGLLAVRYGLASQPV